MLSPGALLLRPRTVVSTPLGKGLILPGSDGTGISECLHLGTADQKIKSSFLHLLRSLSESELGETFTFPGFILT